LTDCALSDGEEGEYPVPVVPGTFGILRLSQAEWILTELWGKYTSEANRTIYAEEEKFIKACKGKRVDSDKRNIMEKVHLYKFQRLGV
jgi:hypothetical protein